MMKSDDGWDDEMNDKEDEYYVKGGARKRKDTVGTTAGSGSNRSRNVASGGENEKRKPMRKTTRDVKGKPF